MLERVFCSVPLVPTTQASRSSPLSTPAKPPAAAAQSPHPDTPKAPLSQFSDSFVEGDKLSRHQCKRVGIGWYCSLRTTIRGKQSTQDIALFIYRDLAADLLGSWLVVVSFDTGGGTLDVASLIAESRGFLFTFQIWARVMSPSRSRHPEFDRFGPGARAAYEGLTNKPDRVLPSVRLLAGSAP
jgi:hypothetical protein